MSGRRPRTDRRIRERAARKLVRDREHLAALSPGGSPERPIEVDSAAVIEIRVESLPCVQCEGQYRIKEHVAPHSGTRRVDVACRQCSAARSIWFRLVSTEPN